MEDFLQVNWELALHSPDLSARPQIVALNKMDICTNPGQVAELEERLRAWGWQVFRISAATHEGLQPLLYAAWQIVQEARASGAGDGASQGTSGEAASSHRVIRGPESRHEREWSIRRAADGAWEVEGRGLERFVQRTDLANEEAVRRLQHTLERAGVHRRLREMGAADGDTVRLGNAEFVFFDEDIHEPGRRRRREKGEPA